MSTKKQEKIQSRNATCNAGKVGLFLESVCNVDLHSKAEQFQPDISSS